MHVCCAPCSTYTLEYLTQFADITVYFANSNIHPKDEYHRRAYVTQQFVSEFNAKTGNTVQFLEADYVPNEYVRQVRGLEEEPEGGDRCRVCFDYRLDKTAQKAVELGFDYFASALTISPHKNSQTINDVGIDVQKVYTTKYLPCGVHSVDTKSEIVKILHFKQFYKHYVFVEDGEGGRKKVLKNYMDVNVCIDMVCGDTKNVFESEE
ncbi:TPA: epoxyqueuosine reductase QueH [Streptococcus pyogenes]